MKTAAVQPNTTAIYQNRQIDKNKVEQLLGLPEFGNEETFFYTSNCTVFAKGYVRIVYGDHGPYVEFRKDQIFCELIKKFGDKELPPKAFYEWLIPLDGSNMKVYDQRRTVLNLKNPPPGGFNGNRQEGYADYIVGMIYVSPWELRYEFNF